jgi:G:T-mismatch repair DNA endonuclease (very short patch repair protein)
MAASGTGTIAPAGRGFRRRTPAIGRRRSRRTARDAATARRLAETGWSALTVWECELKDEAAVAARLARFLRSDKRE